MRYGIAEVFLFLYQCSTQLISNLLGALFTLFYHAISARQFHFFKSVSFDVHVDQQTLEWRGTERAVAPLAP